jgi:hypothetical protein
MCEALRRRPGLIPNADHYVYVSNAEQVAAEMNRFLASLH